MTVVEFTIGAYSALMARLRWLRNRYRKDTKQGEFWLRARQQCMKNGWNRSIVRWFEPEGMSPLELEARYGGGFNYKVQHAPSSTPAPAHVERPAMRAPIQRAAIILPAPTAVDVA